MLFRSALPPMPDTDHDDEDDRTLPPEIEVQLSQLASQAAAQLLQKNMAEAQAQQAQQQAQDPLLQLQQKEVAVKEADVQRKATKDKLDAAARADELELRREEIQGRQAMDAARLLQGERHKQADLHTEGTRIGVDIAKHQTDLSKPTGETVK